ncbi:hypothetical protein NDU88_003499 [Pleurodeles waltl]|uniref:Uncharacterized protein n=1 Tax=Pleurodeles waltl TaxID=8319 RepID=A0AAV7SDT4_PLEWA|nr:hypothetical protein NDU88_003499 [Pleurodeles waltl]
MAGPPIAIKEWSSGTVKPPPGLRNVPRRLQQSRAEPGVREAEMTLTGVAPAQQKIQATLGQLANYVQRLERRAEDAEGRNQQNKVP